MRVLVVNAGSSSLKLRALDDRDEVLVAWELGSVAGLRDSLLALPPVDVVGHRVVHGGARFRESVVLDDDVERRFSDLLDLTPLHNPAALEAIRVVRSHLPDIPAVLCFDTAFHASLPDAAATYALPRRWIDEWGIRRYGFHGLSHAYASRRTAALLGRPAEGLRLVSCHLGAGASLAAVAGGRSLDTTMGFTPLEGLVMATRSGSVDPGVLVWAQRHGGLSVDEIETALEHDSGLLGLAGSSDMRAVTEAAAGGDERRRLRPPTPSLDRGDGRRPRRPRRARVHRWCG